ncbi:MAG: hypothetical protein NXY57DRAFT_286456 [Lentinula lateritia]|uniref:Uncharacterized protein n=1 Tax=Lentinula lateritia TaxID=40482 RepID=A0ABQ8VPV1_9AGAR|nr:MAG: hypothetical protein NXY57DRAFT_286456 [Lentinula lateritia]KAJ4498423.1 hypothetical protein C8R41DRAFT_757384 [Lentinula lateritia]
MLPPYFTSLYRLFLRTSSASVLHQSSAVRNVRSLWRPVFTDAARVINKLQTKPSDHKQKSCQNWLKDWETQMDRTLSLLHASATSRGLPHQLTRNLSQLFHSEYERMSNRKYPVWNAQLPPRSHEYHTRTPDTTPKALNKEKNVRQVQYLEDRAWKALGFAVSMAEGRDKLSLGRVVVKGKLRQN